MSQQILASTGKTLRNVLTQSKQLIRMQDDVNKFLPADMHQHCMVASFHKGCLKFVASSPVWATRLRYCFPDLLRALREQKSWHHLTRLDCKIALFQPAKQKTLRTVNLSQNSASIIQDVADGIKDSELSDALKRLAKNGS